MKSLDISRKHDIGKCGFFVRQFPKIKKLQFY